MDLTEAPAVPLLQQVQDNQLYDHDEVESDEESKSTNGQVYLSSVDTALQEIREKAENVAANSVILQASNSDVTLTRKDLLGIFQSHGILLNKNLLL